MTRSRSDSSEIHASVITALPVCARDAGLDTSVLLRGSGLREEDVAESDGFITIERFARLLELGAILSGDDGFGLKLAGSMELPAAGALDYAVTNAPTVRDSLLTLVQFLPARIDLARVELVVDSKRAQIEWSLPPHIVQRHKLTDFLAAALSRSIGRLFGPSWRPNAVSLESPAPPNPVSHRQYLGPGVTFDREINAICLAAELLDLPIAEADPHLYRIARQLCARELAERLLPRDFISRLREEIGWALAGDGRPQIDGVARRLGISVRSLQRRLARERTSFNGELDETRKRLAERYLRDTDAQLSQIAFRLGFSAPSAFTRAGRRWFGASPMAIRRRGQQAAKMKMPRL